MDGSLLLQCLVLCLIWVDREHASACFRLCAELTAWAHFTIRGIEFDLDDVFSVAVIGWNPIAASLALWACQLLGLPVNVELALVKAVLVTGPAFWYRQPLDQYV